MISRFGLALTAIFRKTCPDPFVLAILLTLVTAALALVYGDFKKASLPPGVQLATGEQLTEGTYEELEDGGVRVEHPVLGEITLDKDDLKAAPAPPPDPPKAVRLADAWRADDGLWYFLKFGMQMCLILVTGHALAVTRPVRRAIAALAVMPRSTAQAAALVSFVACCAAVMNWGLGLIVGALLARDVGRSMSKRGIVTHYPLLCAAGYMGLLVWHGGLSGSAPLTMTKPENAAAVLKPEHLAQIGSEGVALDLTLFSALNLFVTGGLVIGIPFVLALLAPKREADMLPIERFNLAPDDADEIAPDAQSLTVPDRLDRSWVIVWLLALPLLYAIVRYAQEDGLFSIGLNEVNALMLALGLILHGSPRAYMNAVTQGARGCAGIIIQFPLYAGIMAMMAVSGLVRLFAQGFTEAGNETTIPLLSFLSAGAVNLFVPSGGGQWGIQGPIALQAGLDAGIAPGKMIMAVAYGDQLTNMLQPFWALPLLAITGVKARDIVGYTALAMLIAGAWITIGLLIF